jgi:quinol monooxygenase YgiN
MTYGLFGSFSAAPGTRDELVGHLLHAAELLADNEDCLLYLVATTESPDEVTVTEAWTDEAAHDASLDDEATRDLIAKARPLIVGMAQTRLTFSGGKGL